MRGVVSCSALTRFTPTHFPLTLCLVPVVFVVCLLGVAASDSHAAALDSSFVFREVMLPPGVPSVALKDDETALLWNPAGIAMSDVYYIGYAWKGTYIDDERQSATHFFLTKARGFGIGLSRDDLSEGVKNTTYFSVAPRVTRNFAIGFTGKWKGGFNFDCGTVMRIAKRISVGFVGRNLREKKNVRRYWETGVALYAVRGRLLLFSDVIVEDSPWRDATAYGGGFILQLQDWSTVTTSYFTDGEDNQTLRTSLQLVLPRRIIEGEYSTASDDWQTLSGRLSTHSP
jgi:hypothetical protein